MKKAFELVPLLVAGAIGAFFVYVIVNQLDTTNPNRNNGIYAVIGMVTGIGVQVGVRLTGVS